MGDKSIHAPNLDTEIAGFYRWSLCDIPLTGIGRFVNNVKVVKPGERITCQACINKRKQILETYNNNPSKYTDIAQAFSNFELLQHIVGRLIDLTHIDAVKWKISNQGYGWYAVINDCEFFVDAGNNTLSVKCELNDSKLYQSIRIGEGDIVEKLSRWLHDYYSLHYPIKPDLNFALLFARKCLEVEFPEQPEYTLNPGDL